MDTILKSFSLSFLLRSVFAGVFFVISFCVASPGLVEINSNNIYSIAMPFALITGVTIYGLHRSLFYPFIEWGCNTDWAEKLREETLPLISKNSVKNFVRIWDSKSKNGKDQSFQRGEQVAIWADYVHLQYVSAWCIFLGTLSGAIISADFEPIGFILLFIFDVFRGWPLFLLGFIFLIAAMTSNWRLFSVQQYLKHFPPTTESKPN